MVDLRYSLAGFAVGVLVGMTGVGGGSLMTPLLILLFGVNPATAVGTDLLYAAATKTAGSLVHGFARSIDWSIVRRLASGSVPATIVTLIGLSYLDLKSPAARSLITIVLCFALFATAISMIFRHSIMARYGARFSHLDPRNTAAATTVVGVLLGVFVSISSVGAGAIGVMALLVLYPRLPISRIVGSDIAHAVPLTLVAGVGHWMIGAVNWDIIASLLIGSLPGICLGSYFAVRVPEAALRLILAGTLLVVAGKLALGQWQIAYSIVTAFSKRAVH
jgi:uncharacterized protein